MKTLTLALALLFALATPSLAGTRSCTSGMVTLNICRSTSDVAYCLPISTVDPDAGGPRLPPSTLVADAFAATGNWQTPAACTQEMVDAGICTAPQLGQLVAISRAQFADLQVRAFIFQVVKRYIAQLKQAEAQAEAEAEPPPDIGN